jgi:hypothetical protein
MLTLRLMMSEHQDMDRRARIIVEGLVFCAIEPPESDAAKGYEPIPEGGLQISDGAGVQGEGASRFPATPGGCVVHWFFVQRWNRFIHICARDAQLVWLEPAPVASRSPTRALFSGEKIPDRDDPERA